MNKFIKICKILLNNITVSSEFCVKEGKGYLYKKLRMVTYLEGKI